MIRFLGTLCAFFLNALPHAWVLALGDALGWLWFHAVRIRRGVALENLEHALGSELSPALRERLAARNFRHYGRTLIEIVRSLSWDSAAFQRNVQIDNLEIFERVLALNRGAFLLAPHLGNWELGVQVAGCRGLPVDIVVKRAQSPMVQSFLQWYRGRTGLGVFWETGTAREMLRSVARGRGVLCVLDQFMGPPIGLPVNFFGKPAGTAVGLALLTEKRDAPVIPVYNFRDEAGKLHLVFQEPNEFGTLSAQRDERLFQKTQSFNDAMEHAIRKYPEQWLWIHRRWKAYRGTPRWKAAPVLCFVCAVLLGCAGPVPVGDTGIAVPPDPQIQVPQINQVEKKPGESAGQFEIVVVPSTAPVKKRVKKPLPIVITTDRVSVDRIPFEVGEKMELEMGWAALPAGRAILEVRAGEPINGRPTRWLWGNLLSSKLVDAIYHIENTAESWVDAVGIFPYKFLLHMVETDQLKETRVVFDHPKGKAFYWAKRLSKRWGDANDSREDKLVPLAKDMFSAIYYSRLVDFQLGRKQTFPLYENNQNFDVDLTPVANELVTSKLGVFQCWKVLVVVKVDNVLKQTGDMFMWQSDDSKRYLVKFDAKIKIGSLYGNLVSLRERQ